MTDLWRPASEAPKGKRMGSGEIRKVYAVAWVNGITGVRSGYRDLCGCWYQDWTDHLFDPQPDYYMPDPMIPAQPPESEELALWRKVPHDAPCSRDALEWYRAYGATYIRADLAAAYVQGAEQARKLREGK